MDTRSYFRGKMPVLLLGTAVLLGLVIATSVFNGACDRRAARTAGGERKQITVAVTPWPASAAVYIAQEKGYFREEGLEASLRSYPSGHLGLEAVLAGKADLATVGELPITRAAVDGKPFSVVATISEIDRGALIVARKDRGIATPDDLRGKTIGRVAGTTADFYLDIFLTISHVHRKDVRIVDLSPEQVVPALLHGNVDAVSSWVPHTTALQEKLGVHGVVLHEPGLYTATWNIVAKDLAERDPDVLPRFLRGIVRANRLIVDRPAEALAITAVKCGMEIAAVEREWGNFEFMARLDETLLLSLEDEARWLIGKGNGAGRVSPSFMDRMDPKWLMGIDPEAVRLVGE